MAAVRKQRWAAEDRRLQIVALAQELFAERGYHGASMSELARRAGVTKPVIYDVIGGKEDLFRLCCEQSANEVGLEIAAAVGAETTGPGRLRAGALAGFRFAARHRREGAVLFPEANGPFSEVLVTMRRRSAELIAVLLADEAARNAVEVEPLQLEAIAHGLSAAFEGLMLWWRDHPRLSAETLADWFVTLSLPGLESLLGTPA